MEQIKLIAIDLDGTLLNSNSKVSQENLSAIHGLKDCGIDFVPCSGRTVAEMPDSIVNNPDIRYIIHSNGCAILDKQTGKNTFTSIASDTTKKIFDTLCNFQTHLTIRANGCCYIETNTDSDYHIAFYNIWTAHVDVMKKCALKVDNLKEWLLSTENVSFVSAFFHDENERQKCIEILSKEEDLLVVSVAPFNIEIMNKKAGKGNAIIALSKMLNVDLKNVAGVGDSGNDMPMMKVAKIRFAVSNATDELKSVCDHVICSNDEHAVEYILNNFILKD